MPANTRGIEASSVHRSPFRQKSQSRGTVTPLNPGKRCSARTRWRKSQVGFVGRSIFDPQFFARRFLQSRTAHPRAEKWPCLTPVAGITVRSLRSDLLGRNRENGHYSRIFQEIKARIFCSPDLLAEREGFEPPVPFRARRFSRPEPSTTRPPLRGLG